MKRGWFLEEVLLQQQTGNDAMKIQGGIYNILDRTAILRKWHRYRGTYLTNRESCRLLAWIIFSWRVVLVLLQEWFGSLKDALRYHSLKTVKKMKNLPKCGIWSLFANPVTFVDCKTQDYYLGQVKSCTCHSYCWAKYLSFYSFLATLAFHFYCLLCTREEFGPRNKIGGHINILPRKYEHLT